MAKFSIVIDLGLLLFALCYIKAEDDFVCPERFGYYSHPKDPHKFIECVENKPFIFDCPAGLVFSPSTKNCDFTVGPTGNPILTTDTGTPPTGTRPRHSSEPTQTPVVHTNTPDVHSNTPDVHTNTPEALTTATGRPRHSSEPTQTPVVHTNTPDVHSNTPEVHTNTPEALTTGTGRERHTSQAAKF